MSPHKTPSPAVLNAQLAHLTAQRDRLNEEIERITTDLRLTNASKSEGRR